MKNAKSAILLIAAWTIVLANSVAWTASSPTKVTIHVPSKSLAIMPYYFGKDKGFFAPELVEPQLINTLVEAQLVNKRHAQMVRRIAELKRTKVASK